MPNVFPTNFSDKTTPVAWDKVMGYDSVANDNKNLTVGWIWTTAFADRNTDNLSEWVTNKYASTTNVNAAWATMNTDTTLVWNSWFLDDDTMAWDDATKVPSQQSVKAYVDNFVLPIASETVSWIVERATNAEATAWTDTTRYISPKQAKDNYWVFTPIAWTVLQAFTAPTFRTTVATSYTKLKEVQILLTWTYTVNFTLWTLWWWAVPYGKIYKNWVAFWTEWTSVSAWEVKTEDLAFTQWDLIQVYAYTDNASFYASVAAFNATYNLSVWTVITD